MADIERLINEHGSAAILREKVGLLETQRTIAIDERDAMLEKMRHLESENHVLKSDKANLEAQLNDTQQQLADLKKPMQPPLECMLPVISGGLDLGVTETLRKMHGI